MDWIFKILGAFLGPLMEMLRQRHEDDMDRAQTERITREAATTASELERARENLDNAQERQEIDEEVARLPDDVVVSKLRRRARTPAGDDNGQ